MTDTSHRIYAVALALVVFFVTWAGVAARPWAGSQPDARIAALAQREAHLRVDAQLVKQILDQRMAVYKLALTQRQAQIATARSLQSVQSVSAAAPSVRVVNLPPLTITRTS